MTVQINYKNKFTKKETSNLVLFVDEKFNISTLKKHILSSEYSYILDLVKTKDRKKKILTFDINSKKKIILVAFKNKLTFPSLSSAAPPCSGQCHGHRVAGHARSYVRHTACRYRQRPPGCFSA